VRDLIKRGCTLEECSELVRTLVEDHSPQSSKSNCGGQRKTNGELLAQLHAGDEDAFGLVVQRYGGPNAGDCAQISEQRTRRSGCRPGGVRFRIFARLNKFNGDAMLSTWLHRIVVKRLARAVAIPGAGGVSNP